MSRTSYSVSESDKARGKYVPWVIAAFFISFMLPLFGFTYIAFNNKPSEVTTNAYNKGLAYNKILAEAEAEKKLGWKSDIEVKNNRLVFRLSDAKNRPISNAEVKAWLVRPSEAAMDKKYELMETGRGIYEATVSLEKGLWDARITAESGNHEFQSSKTFTAE